MLSPASRKARELQRYDKGCRQVVGYTESNQLPSVVEEVEVLLISSQKSQRMMFPKGGWEIDKDIKQAAIRETLEEAGVDGILGPKLNDWKFKSKSRGRFHEGHMFPLLVTQRFDLWPEKDVRQRIWEAREACYHWWMKEALDIFVGWLMHQQQQTEEDNRRPCSLEFLTDEPRIGVVAQSGEDGVDRCLVS